MKKIIALLLTLMLIIPATSALAYDWEYEITVTYNGEPIDFEVEPQIINDRTMVPFRAIFETLGGTVDFDPATRTVSSEKDGETLSFVIGEYEATKKTESGEEKIAIDTAPIIVDDYTLVPVRFVAESSGCKVNWDEFFREVVIIDTDAWRKTIEESSEFMAMLIDMPLNAQKAEQAFESKEETNIKFSLSLENLEGIQDINCSVNLKILSDEFYDGENILSENSIALDLASIGKVIKSLSKETGAVIEKEDEALLNEIFKIHNINLEVIVDKDNNVYLKSKEIIDLMKKSGAEKEALFIGDNYIKISLPNDVPSFDEDITTWEFIEAMILSDELYSEDVIMIEYIINMVCDVYSDENAKITKKADGSQEITIDITNDDWMKAIENMIDAIWEFEEAYMGTSDKQFIELYKKDMLKALGIFELYAKGKIIIKDEVNQSANLEMSFKINDMIIPGTENTKLNAGLELKMKSSSNEASNREKVEIPENAIDIMNY